MGVLKTLGYASFISFLAATAVRPEEDLLRRVTECVGRLSAQIEHHWLMSDQATDTIETQRAHLEDILDALITPENATLVLSKRIDAKMAHASLLTHSELSNDDRSARWAENRAKQELRQCGTILLQPASESIALRDNPTVSDMNSVNQGAWKASQ
jgi:hypothetical protein